MLNRRLIVFTRQVCNLTIAFLLLLLVVAVFAWSKFPCTVIRSAEILIAIYHRFAICRTPRRSESKSEKKRSPKDTIGCAVGWREEEDIFERCLEGLKFSDVNTVVVGIDGDNVEDLPMVKVFSDVFPDAPPPIHLDFPPGDALLDPSGSPSIDVEVLLDHIERQITAQLGIESSALPNFDAICIHQPHRNKKTILFTALLTSLVMARAKDATFIFSCDSDSVAAPHAIDDIIASLRTRPQAGGSSGRLRTWTANQTILGKLQSAKWWSDQDVYRIQTAFIGSVECQPGPSSAFRAAALQQVLIPWYVASAWGRRCLVNEDRELTSKLLHANWEVHFVPHAVIWTDCPSTLPAWCRQQLRWSRGAMFQRLSTPRLYANINPFFTMHVVKDFLLPIIGPGFLVYYIATGKVLLQLSPYDLALTVVAELIYAFSTAADVMPWQDWVYLLPSRTFYSLTKPAIHTWSLLTMFENSWGSRLDFSAWSWLTLSEYAWACAWIYLFIACQMRYIAQRVNEYQRDAIDETSAVLVFPVVAALCSMLAWHFAVSKPTKPVALMQAGSPV